MLPLRCSAVLYFLVPLQPSLPLTIVGWLGGSLCAYRRTGSDMAFPNESDMLVLVSICTGGGVFLDIPGVGLSNGTNAQQEH